MVSDALPIRAYEEVTNASALTLTLTGINVANTSDVISAALHYAIGPNSVVVSKNGSMVYASEFVNGAPTIAIFHVTATGLVADGTVTLPTTGMALPSLGSVGGSIELALTPDGSTLFATLNYSGPTVKQDAHWQNGTAPGFIFQVNLATDAAEALTGSVIANPSGVVVSPDGKRVYVATDDQSYILDFPVGTTALDTSNEITAGIVSNPHPGLAIDPAGTVLYIGNENAGSVTALTLSNLDHSTPVTQQSQIYGVAVSMDGSHLFFVNGSANTVSSYNPDGSGGVTQSAISGAIGLGISPNNTSLYVSQIATSSPNLTTILNPVVFTATPSTVTIDGGSGFGGSETVGNFVG